MCFNARFIGKMDDYTDDLCYVDDMYDAQVVCRGRQRAFERWNPLDELDDIEFIRRFRFSKPNMWRLDALVSPKLDDVQSERGNNVTPTVQLLVTMRYLATGCFQRVTADFMGVSTCSTCRIIRRVCSIIAAMHKEYIAFPDTIAENQKVKQAFYEYCQFPGIVGSIDCTHIPIQNPGGGYAEMYRNRKGYFSVNVQAVTDVNLKINNIVCRWPGSTHDSRIFENSRIGTKFEDGQINGILLGDGGYPCKPYLMTPFQNPLTGPERRYNYSHKKGRSTVERLFGVWKRRFPCLSRTIRMKPKRAVVVISCCAVLYNLLKLWGDSLLPDNDDGCADHPDQDDMQPAVADQNDRGNRRRQLIVTHHFS